MNAEIDSTRLIAGGIPIEDVMQRLGQDRPVFHSEADLQHSFARTLWELAPEVQCRLEVPQRRQGRTEHLDMMCLGPTSHTAIEFKYWTRSWSGVAGPLGEEYSLRSHAATDLARRNFIFDIARLENFCAQPGEDGIALIITNAASLWTPPEPGRNKTRDHDFRIHQGRTLEGTLLWAKGSYTPNTRVLRGTYPLDWQPYSAQPGTGGEFRYLAAFVTGPRGVRRA